jgi:hypothetical protein
MMTGASPDPYVMVGVSVQRADTESPFTASKLEVLAYLRKILAAGHPFAGQQADKSRSR